MVEISCRNFLKTMEEEMMGRKYKPHIKPYRSRMEDRDVHWGDNLDQLVEQSPLLSITCIWSTIHLQEFYTQQNYPSKLKEKLRHSQKNKNWRISTLLDMTYKKY